MDEVVIDFADASTQVFHIGEASVAVPGLVPGLEEAHARRGRLPWARLFVPALELAQRAFEATPRRRSCTRSSSRSCSARPAGGASTARPGVIDARDLVPTLQAAPRRRPEADRDAASRPRGRSRRVRRRAERAAGRRLRRRRRADDTCAVARRQRRAGRSRGARRALDEPAGSAAEARSLAAALAGGVRRPGRRAAAHGRRARRTSRSSTATALPSALSSTLGSGSGVFRHGFQLNNMLGELDVIGVDVREPGTRLPSMMAPTLVLDDGRAAARRRKRGLRSARGRDPPGRRGVVRQGLPVAEAIARPRLHVDGETVHVEGGWADGVAEALAEEGYEAVVWAGSQPLLRRRLGRRAAPEGHPRRCRRPPARRVRCRRPMIAIRPAEPGRRARSSSPSRPRSAASRATGS